MDMTMVEENSSTEDRMKETTTRTLRQGIGYTGRLGQKAYMARIIGTDPQYGLRREFLDAAKVERDKFNSAKYVRTYTHELTEGLYERQSEGDRDYVLIFCREGQWGYNTPSDERIAAIAALMDDGTSAHDARVATKP